MRVRCSECKFSRKTSRYEVFCRVYGVLKIALYPRLCRAFIWRGEKDIG